MSLIERAKNICLTPATEWPVIAAEPTSPGTLVSSYVVPLAAVGAEPRVSAIFGTVSL